MSDSPASACCLDKISVQPPLKTGISPAHVVIWAGVSAALHVGKLSPALPVLREALGITLLQSGFLLSMVQLAGMTLGLAVGLAADGVGLRRSLLTGLLVLFGVGALGGWAQDATSLIVLRALEGFGFLLVSMPAPSLVRQLVAPHRLSAMLGFWGAYMPLGTAVALLSGPLVINVASWQVWWWGTAGLSLLMAVWVWRVVPSDQQRRPASEAIAGASAQAGWPQRLCQTLVSPGPWLVALSFAVYSGQWLAVIGFLPSIYAQAGVAGGTSAVLTALAALCEYRGQSGFRASAAAGQFGAASAVYWFFCHGCWGFSGLCHLAFGGWLGLAAAGTFRRHPVVLCGGRHDSGHLVFTGGAVGAG